MPDEMITLQQQLQRLQTQIAHLELALEEKPNYGPGQGDPAITRWEINHALLQELKQRAVGLEQALQRANQGTYGICERCDVPIHPDRLAVLPGVRICIRCARAGEPM